MIPLEKKINICKGKTLSHPYLCFGEHGLNTIMEIYILSVK